MTYFNINTSVRSGDRGPARGGLRRRAVRFAITVLGIAFGALAVMGVLIYLPGAF